jgi:hypothetical protein
VVLASGKLFTTVGLCGSGCLDLYQLFDVSWSAGFKVYYLLLLLSLAIWDGLVLEKAVDKVSFFFERKLFRMFNEFVIRIFDIRLATIFSY